MSIEDTLNKEVAGMPVWVWGGILIAGIAAAYIIPKFFAKQQPSTQSSDQALADQSAAAGMSGLGVAIDPATGLPYAVEGMVPAGGLAGGGGTPPAPPAPSPSPPPSPAPSGGGSGPTSTAFYVTKTGDTLNSIAQSMVGGLQNVGWLQSWNNQYANQPWFSKPWWTIPAGTVITIPYKGSNPPAGTSSTNPGGSSGGSSMPVYVTVQAWPSQYSTLSGIAAANGLTLSQIEALNPQITNPNLIYPGEQVRIR